MINKVMNFPVVPPNPQDHCESFRSSISHIAGLCRQQIQQTSLDEWHDQFQDWPKKVQVGGGGGGESEYPWAWAHWLVDALHSYVVHF